MLNRVPGKLVIDHIGKFLGPTQPDGEAFLCLRRLLDKGDCWVKLSAPYESSRSGASEYADVAPLVRFLALHYPDRCLWASNWLHPNVNPKPSNTALLDWALECFGNESTRRRILVCNPTELYGF